MTLRTAAFRLLPAALLLLSACSESNPKTETATSAKEETMATTADALDSSKSASPSAAPATAVTPRPNRLTAPDTTYAQDVALFLGGQ